MGCAPRVSFAGSRIEEIGAPRARDAREAQIFIALRLLARVFSLGA
jgi:hypothetical protein